MSYLGNAPARSFISFERQVFTIVNSQTAYALSHSVTNENDIRLVVNNVVQEPGSGKAYTATGTALTLSAALTNGTDEMYCVFLGRATATNAPGAGSVGTSQLASDSVTLAKMASGTDGNIISYDASGNPVAVATGSAGQILTSAGAGAPPVFETPVSVANTPAFSAQMSGAQTISHASVTKVSFNSEIFDTDGCYDPSSNYRFTPTTAGKYYINLNINVDGQGQGNLRISQIQIYKNGSAFSSCGDDKATGYENGGTLSLSSVITMNGSSDYLEAYAYMYVQDSSTSTIGGSTTNIALFSGYKLIGV